MLLVVALLGAPPAAAQVLYCGRTLQEWRQLAVNVIDERAAACGPGHSIRGTRGSDLILGSPCADNIEGGEGEDCIYGMGGNDFIRGQQGDDEIHGGAGNDRIWGDSGHDRLFGEGQDDYLKGESGADQLHGGGGHDVLYGGSGRDLIFGAADHDEIWGDSGRDQIYGGGGGDYVRGDAGKDLICGGEGNDALYGDAGGDDIDGGPGSNRCDGGDRLLPRFLRGNHCWRCSISPEKSCEAKSGVLCHEPAPSWCAGGFQAVAGTCDGALACGEGGGRERSSPRPDLYQYLYDQAQTQGGTVSLDFDEVPGQEGVGGPGRFGHTFQDLPADICGGRLEVTLAPGAEGLDDDRINLGLVGESFAYGAGLVLEPGKPETVTYDLDGLDPVLAAMSDGFLDVVVGDSSGVDCIRLCVQTGCPFDCPEGAQHVAGRFNWWWTEKNPTTEPTADCDTVRQAAENQGIDLATRFADICTQKVPGSQPLSFQLTRCQIRTDALGPFNATIAMGGCCTVPDRPDLEIAKSLASTEGSVAVYTLQVRNRGAGATIGPISVVDTLPPGATLSGASGSGWTCEEDAEETLVVVTCEYSGGTVAAGDSLPALEIRATPAYAAGENCARVDTPDDAEPANNLDCVEISCPQGSLTARAEKVFASGECAEVLGLAQSAETLASPEYTAACRQAGGSGPALGAALLSCETGPDDRFSRAEVELCCQAAEACPAPSQTLEVAFWDYDSCEHARAAVPRDLDRFSAYCRRGFGATMGDVRQATLLGCERDERGLRTDVRICCGSSEVPCSAGQQRTTASNLHYSRSEYESCEAASAHAQDEANLTSYHYRKACQDAVGGTLPDQVAAAQVTRCRQEGSSFVVEVEVCCPRPSGACDNDEECAPDRWCRPTESGERECVTFAGEGERCEGHVAPWAFERCAPGLICTDWPEPTHDIPGVCREPEEKPTCWRPEGPAGADSPLWRAASRSDAAGVAHLLLTIDTASREPVDEVRIDLPRRTARAAEPAHLPPGWALTRDGSTLIFQGPATEPPLHLKLDVQGHRVPDRVDFEVHSSGDRVARREGEPVARLPPMSAANSLRGLVVLPPEISPGETIQIRAVDPARTPAGGRWSIGGQVLGPWQPPADVDCLQDPIRDPIWIFKVPLDWRPGRRVPVTYEDPWGEVVADVPDAGIDIGAGEFEDLNGNGVWDEGEPVADGSPIPSITGGSEVVLAGGQACVCGHFPGTEPRNSLLLDGRLLGPPLTASEDALYVDLPESLELGTHTLAGWTGAGFTSQDEWSFQLIQVRGSLDREQLFRGGSTEMHLRIVGTREPVALRIRNRTPEIITLEGGDDLTLITSGGEDNSLSHPVLARQQGAFNIEWSLPGCPCDSDRER